MAPHLKTAVAVLFAAHARCVAEKPVLGMINGRVRFSHDILETLPADMGILSAKVVLDGGLLTALPSSSGDFVVNDVPAGPHLLQVVHPNLFFDAVRIEAATGPRGQLKMMAYLADFESGRGARLNYPLRLTPSGRSLTLSERREELSMHSGITSPMAMISFMSLVCIFWLPKLRCMSEDERKRRFLNVNSELGTIPEGPEIE